MQLGELLPIASRDALLAAIPDLAGAWVADLDLRDLDVNWHTVDVTGATFAGCGLASGAESALRGRGAMVLPPFDSFEFSPYRPSLYTNAELMEGYETGRPETTRDAKIGAWSLEPSAPLAALARGMHDACIDAALIRFLTEIGPVVGIMGGHAFSRSAPQYRDVAELGRRLTRAGLTVATGGGPGLMEAANLGAWLAHAPPDALDDALGLLVRAPHYLDDRAGFLERALDVRAMWPDGSVNLGVPTWIYIDEPINQFATHLAKYFQNSIRENGLLAIAHAGVVYTPGGSGTAQEIFTDAAQNDYSLYGPRSAMVFLGVRHYEHEHPGLVAAVRTQAELGGWGDLVCVVDDVEEAVEAILERLPAEVVLPRPPWRKR